MQVMTLYKSITQSLLGTPTMKISNLLIIWLTTTSLLFLNGSESSQSSSSSQAPATRARVQSSALEGLKDPIDQAIAMALHIEQFSDEKIYDQLEVLKQQEETLESSIQENRRKDKNNSNEAESIKLKAVVYALKELRINWAKKILTKETPDTAPQELDRCIEELETYISSESIIVAEPHRKESKVDLRITEVEDHLQRRAESGTQLEEDIWLWRKLIKKTEEHQSAESKYPAAQSSSSTADIRSRESIRTKKQEKFKQIATLLEECKQLDVQCVSKESQADDDQPIENKDLNAHYDRLHILLKMLVEHLPFGEAHSEGLVIMELQSQLMNLLTLEQMTAETVLTAMTSLHALNNACMQNRKALQPYLTNKKEELAQEYARLRKELESIKVLLVRLKVLANKPLGEFEKQRLKKYNALKNLAQDDS
jgi:hypothetical protein